MNVLIVVLIVLLLMHVLATAWLKPSLNELFSLTWHREFHMKFIMRLLSYIFPYVAGKWGERGIKGLQFVFYEAGRARGKLIRKALQIDPNDARSVGRVLDFEDGMVGVRGTWSAETRGRAVKEERYCPAQKELERCPEVCAFLMTAMEAGTFSGWAPRLVPGLLTRLLSLGHDCCRAEILVAPEDGSSNYDTKISPHATPGAFPPVLKVPFLILRMNIRMLFGFLRGIIKVLISGPDQHMDWYEKLRYIPGVTRIIQQ